MGSMRFRFGSILEWVLAAAVVFALVAVGATFLREYRTVRPVVEVMAGESDEAVPSGIPPRAVSMPMLLLGEGRRILVGDPASTIEALLGAGTGAESRDQGAHGERVTRFYTDGRTQFVLVFSAPADGAEPHVTAIYLWEQ